MEMLVVTGGFRFRYHERARARPDRRPRRLAAVAELCVDVVGGHEGELHCGVEYTPEEGSGGAAGPGQ
ncbi:MAG: hypothetical protein ACREXX_05770 [Gammaproteobacteria bacterium]